MKREHIFTLLLALLVVIALVQTFQLTGLKGRITTSAVQDVQLPQAEPPVPPPALADLPANVSGDIE